MAVEKIINLKVNDDIKDTENNVVSLKRQLREAQQDVQNLADKFGATSREAVEAAKKAAELKDRIGDAKNLTDAFNPDAKFKALTASLSGVAGGFAAAQGAIGLFGVESENIQKTLLKVQSAMALSQGIQALGEAKDSFKQLGAVAGDALKGIKTGVAATGIGLLVIALGAIVAYWDDIKQAVNGVSAAQSNLNAKVNANYQTQLLNLKTLDNQDNVLRLQGKSEDYILKKKNEQITKAIESGQLALKQNISNVKAEVAAAERNERYTKLIFQRSLQLGTFMVRMIAKPFDLIIAGVNKVSDALGFQKVAAMNVTDVLDAGIDKATTFVSTKLFDSAGIKAEGEAATLALTQELQNLENTKAGNQIKINEGNKKAGKENKDNTEKSIKEGFDAEQKLVEEKLKNDKISIDEKRNIVLEDNKLSKEDRLKFLLELQEQEIELEEAHNKAIADLNKRYDDEKANRLADTNVKKEQLDYERRLTEINNIAQTELEKQTLIEKLNGEHAVRLADATKSDNEKKLAEAKAFADQEIALDLATKQAKRDALNTGLDILMQFAGKNKAVALSILAVQKGLAIADIIVNASKALAVGAANLATIPAVLPPGIPNPAFPLAVAATAKSAVITKITAATSIASILAAGIGQAQSITSGGGGGGGGASSGGGSAAAPPSFNIVGQNSNNQLAQTIAGQQQQPLQAYVVSGNVSSAQSLDRNRIDTATFN